MNIKDLAQMLSLNPSTVSRALSDHPDIKKETKEKVKAAALEFNYQPNLHAKYFRQKTSGLIAVVLPEFNMFFYPELMKGISSVIEDAGRSIIIFFSNNDFEKEKDIINHCLSWSVDGILISLSENTQNCDHLVTLKSAGIPIVLMDKVIFNESFTTLTIDDEKAAYDATKMILNAGKTNLLGLFGNADLQITKSRLKGFHMALDGLKVKSDFKYLSIKDNAKIEQLKNLILNDHFDGIFAMSDELLLQAHAILQQYKLYPKHVILSAISDGILPRQLYPPVSFVHHSGYDLGEKAAATLLAIKDQKSESQHIQLQTKIVTSI